MRKKLSLILIAVMILLCFCGCSARMTATGVYHTDYEGVYITIDRIDDTADKGSDIKVVWHNEGDCYISFGLWYTVEYLDGEEWKNIQITDFAIPEIACTLEAGESLTKSYSTKYFNTLRSGIYRIRTEFYIPEKNLGSKSAWAQFEVSYD